MALWTKKQVEVLLKAYLEYPVLFKKDHPGYQDQTARYSAHVMCLHKLQEVRPGIAIPTMLRKFKMLRISYNKIKQELESSKGEETPKRLPFFCKYFRRMEGKEDEPLSSESEEEKSDGDSSEDEVPGGRRSPFSEKVLEGLVTATQVLSTLQEKGKSTEEKPDFAKSAGDLLCQSMRKLDFPDQLRVLNHMTALFDELLDRSDRFTNS